MTALALHIDAFWIQAWIRSDPMPIREERSTHTIWYGTPRAPLSPAGLAARDKLVRAATAWLGDRTQLFTSWSIADADLALVLRRVIDDELPTPLVRYVEAQLARPSMAKWHTHARPPYRPY
jgi:glutathione S-transferase